MKQDHWARPKWLEYDPETGLWRKRPESPGPGEAPAPAPPDDPENGDDATGDEQP